MSLVRDASAVALTACGLAVTIAVTAALPPDRTIDQQSTVATAQEASQPEVPEAVLVAQALDGMTGSTEFRCAEITGTGLVIVATYEWNGSGGRIWRDTDVVEGKCTER